MIEKMVEVGILFDFYGKLLTDKQYEAVELYYMNDLSLGEIAEKIDVSRQGIFDMLKRAEKNLYDYEDKLGLVSKFRMSYDGLKDIISYSDEISDLIKEDNVEVEKLLDKIRDIGKELLIEER